jgi:hypothetical protein
MAPIARPPARCLKVPEASRTAKIPRTDTWIEASIDGNESHFTVRFLVTNGAVVAFLVDVEFAPA